MDLGEAPRDLRDRHAELGAKYPNLGGSDMSRGIRDITDGTSNTISFGEWKMGDFDINKLSITDVINMLASTSAGIGGEDSWNGNSFSFPNNMPSNGYTNLQQFLRTCAGAAPGSVRGTGRPTRAASATPGSRACSATRWVTRSLPPNSPYPNCQLEPWGGDMDSPGIYGLSSYHPGGCNVAFADGSVRFLKSSTAVQRDLGAWLASRRRGHLVGLVLIRVGSMRRPSASGALRAARPRGLISARPPARLEAKSRA